MWRKKHRYGGMKDDVRASGGERRRNGQGPAWNGVENLLDEKHERFGSGSWN